MILLPDACPEIDKQIAWRGHGKTAEYFYLLFDLKYLHSAS